jgi:hypothetical protein
MIDIKDAIIADLIKKNRDLSLRLLNASEWMSKDVAEKQQIIDGEIEEIHVGDIKKSISSFLKDFPLSHDEENIIDDLQSSEILFVHMQKDPNIDGTAVIIDHTSISSVRVKTMQKHP